MPLQPNTVRIVVDPVFGERLASLPSDIPVWVVDSPVNKPVVQRLWRERQQGNQEKFSAGITAYTVSEGSSPEEYLLNEFDMIDLHHPQHTKVEVIGAPLTSEIRFKLADYGFQQFSSTSDGFVAVSQLPASRV